MVEEKEDVGDDNRDEIDSNQQEGTIKLINGGNTKYLDILEFQSRFNDDIFRLVLSFLDIVDLIRLERVSKNLRLSQLSGEDSEVWKQCYLKKVPGLYEMVKRSCPKDQQLMLPFLYKTNNFKIMITEAVKLFDNLVEKNCKERMKRAKEHIKEAYSKPTVKNAYVTKEELLKFKIPEQKVKKEEGIKLLALGDGGIGKTCLMIKLITGKYPEEYIPTVMDNYMDNYQLENNVYRICYWDTASSDDYPRLRVLAYPQTDVFLAMYSCVQDYSFQNMFCVWLTEVRHHVPDAATVLVATKVDLRNDAEIKSKLMERHLTRPISYKDGEKAAKLSDCFTYIETSSLKDIGISDFTEIALKAHFKNVSLRKDIHEKKKCFLQ